jgi:hypothetical protein
MYNLKPILVLHRHLLLFRKHKNKSTILKTNNIYPKCNKKSEIDKKKDLNKNLTQINST